MFTNTPTTLGLIIQPSKTAGTIVLYSTEIQKVLNILCG